MIQTPHIKCEDNAFGKTVIMPGDPLRSKMIAETFLEDAVLVNNVRGIQGYTGYYKGKKVSVMASGMGNPTMGIYSYELFKFCGVDKIIRVGSIGAMKEDIKIKDVIIAENCHSNTNYNNFYINNGEGLISASKKLVDKIKKQAKKTSSNSSQIHIGNILNSDTFYTDENELAKAQANNLLGVEMESAALYINAQRLNKEALTICTVSDNLITGEKASPEERQTNFKDMVKLALSLI